MYLEGGKGATGTKDAAVVEDAMQEIRALRESNREILAMARTLMDVVERMMRELREGLTGQGDPL